MGIRLALVLAVWIGATSAAAQPAWTRFKSASGYSVAYPSSWSRIGADDNELDLLSPGEREEGVVIGRGQAEVIIDELSTTTALLDWQRRTAGSDPVSMKSYSGVEEPRGCGPLRAISTDIDGGQGSGDVERDVSLLCTAGHRRFGLLLRHWRDDPKAGAFLATALQIARSLRVS